MQSVAVIVPGPLILPCFFPPRVSGVGFGRIDDLCWLGAVRRNLPGSIVLTVGFWVLGAISFYIGGTKKSILLQGVLLVGIDVLLTLVKHLFQYVGCRRLHLYVLRFACGLPLNQSSLLKVLHVL